MERRLPPGVIAALGLAATTARADSGDSGDSGDTAEVHACLSFEAPSCQCEDVGAESAVLGVAAGVALLIGRRDRRSLVERVAGSGALAPDVARRVLERKDEG